MTLSRTGRMKKLFGPRPTLRCPPYWGLFGIGVAVVNLWMIPSKISNNISKVPPPPRSSNAFNFDVTTAIENETAGTSSAVAVDLRYRALVPPSVVAAFPHSSPITCDLQAPLPPTPSTFLLTQVTKAPEVTKQAKVSYLWHCMKQIRLTNPKARIVLLMDEAEPWDVSSKAKEEFDIIVCTTSHPRREKTIGQDGRFHMIAPLMKLLDLRNIWHIESDNLIYSDFTKYTQIASLLFSETAAVPLGSGQKSGYMMTGGIMFFRDYLAAETLGYYSWDKISQRDNAGYNALNNDMRDLGMIQQEQGTSFLANLPTLPYGKFSRYAESFNSLFDAAGYGQFVDGVGRAMPPSQHHNKGFATPIHFIGDGFISGKISLSWERDGKNLWFPQVLDTKTKKAYRLNNMHIYVSYPSSFVQPFFVKIDAFCNHWGHNKTIVKAPVRILLKSNEHACHAQQSYTK